MIRRLLIGTIPVLLISGCAAMFNQDYDRAEVFGPKGITATDPSGNPLVIHHDYDQQFLMLPKYDSFVTFHYGSASKRVALHRSYCSLTLLDYLNFLGLYVDDALGTWREYDPINGVIDSNSGADTTLTVPTPSFWESKDRPRLLLAFGFGIPTEVYAPYGDGLEHGEYQLGLSLQHKIELYYCGASEGLFGEITARQYYLPVVSIQSPILRYYPWGNYYFIEAGPSFVHVTLDSSWWNHVSYSEYTNAISEHLDALTAGIGWCGDLSYFDFRYEFGFKPYQFFNLIPQQFREFILSFGMVFRI